MDALVEDAPTLIRRKVQAFGTSALVGVVASVVDWLVLVLAVHGGVSQRYAVVPAFVAGAAVQFLGNRRFAFDAHRDGSRAVWMRQIVRFVGIEMCTLALNAVLYAVLREGAGIDYRLARPIAAFVVYAGFSFPMWRWVFRRV